MNPRNERLFVLVITITVLIANMLADLMYVFLDPRTRES